MDLNQYFGDNVDIERFGPSSKKTCKQRTRNWVKNKFRNKIPVNICDAIDNIREHFTGLSDLYFILADEGSKKLLIKIIAYRLLGQERVKLPLNTPQYWEKRRYVESIKENHDSLTIANIDWKLFKFALESINYPISIYSVPMGICAVFMVKNYEFRNSNTVIKAEEGDVVIDAGGCWGDTALYFAHEVGASGKVYSFEFIPGNLEIMSKNINLNPSLINRIKIIQTPLWDKTGELFYFLDNGPESKVSGTKQTDEYLPISTISIDDFVSQNNIKKIDFIKMDIEGAEFSALQGAINTIKRCKPKLAISLYHGLNDFVDIPKFISSLDLGYEFHLGHFTIHSEETVLFARSK